MNAAEFDALLRQFLVDEKLSANERKVLSNWIAQNVTTEQQRGVARHRLFEVVRGAAIDPSTVQLIRFLEDVLKVLIPMEANAAVANKPDQAFFSPGEACLSQIVHRFHAAKQRVDVCVFTITDDRISRAILAAHQRGVKIRIITDDDKANDPGSDVDQLRQAGIPLKMDKTPYHMHHKFAIFDQTRLINGSYNWTRGAAEFNEENILDTSDPTIIKLFQKEFDSLWEKLE
jgi:phosphatidylserine/phosphatidylglycerophosphate/cardiolipin synthase-like enzyme